MLQEGDAHVFMVEHESMEDEDFIDVCVDTPRRVQALVGQVVVQVSAGNSHSIVSTAAGVVYTFGCGVSGKLGHGDEANMWIPRVVELED